MIWPSLSARLTASTASGSVLRLWPFSALIKKVPIIFFSFKKSKILLVTSGLGPSSTILSYLMI